MKKYKVLNKIFTNEEYNEANNYAIRNGLWTFEEIDGNTSNPIKIKPHCEKKKADYVLVIDNSLIAIPITTGVYIDLLLKNGGTKKTNLQVKIPKIGTVFLINPYKYNFVDYNISVLDMENFRVKYNLNDEEFWGTFRDLNLTN